MTYRALMMLGPTASGKTAASLFLAQHYPIEIISVDSALVYRGMDIGSAKPSVSERRVCPHHLIDICEISEPYSAADFREDAMELIESIRHRGRIPVIVGGTMLYAKALREGIDELPTTMPEVRNQILQEAQTVGWASMHRKLSAVDPVTASRLAPLDSQRICRALEVWEMTGRPLSALQSGARNPDPSILTVGFIPSDRGRMHAAISKRFDIMIEQGLVQEVRDLMAREDFSADLPSMRSVGYRQCIEYLNGQSDLETFIEKAKAATRQLAKRQMTWLRSMPQIERIDPHDGEAPMLERIRALIESQF